jgi:hypothetical protein
VRVLDNANVKIDSVMVQGSQSDGIEIGAGAQVSITRTTVEGSKLYGISAFETGDITIEASIINGALLPSLETDSGPGVWVQHDCAQACACGDAPKVTMRSVVACGNGLIGVSLAGVIGDLANVEVKKTFPYRATLDLGGGLAISGCSNVAAKGLNVTENQAYGVLIDQSLVTLGGPALNEQIHISKNYTGMWIQNLNGLPGGSEEAVRVVDCEIIENFGVGLGLGSNSGSGLEERGIVIHGKVQGTQTHKIPTFDYITSTTSIKEVGDGVVWAGGARAVLDRLELSGNARMSILIDGSVAEGSSIIEPAFSGGDDAEERGIVIHGLPPDGVEPALVGVTGSAVHKVSAGTYSIPVFPASPVLSAP